MQYKYHVSYAVVKFTGLNYLQTLGKARVAVKLEIREVKDQSGN